jgi:hypothetical protein
LILAMVAVAIGLAAWWQRQLSVQLAAAAERGQLDACLRYSSQLHALRWIPGHPPHDQDRCRRAKASLLWQRQQWAEALQLQRQLLASPTVTGADRQRFNDWQAELQNTALSRFRAGDLKGALAALAPIGEDHRADGNALGDQLRQNWNRNRLESERASKLVRQARWWEALDSLHRLDHPWWQRQAQQLNRRVQQGLALLKQTESEHDGHGDLPHTVPVAQLDAEVGKRIAAGLDEWKAFEAACRALGGRVVEAGPETACQR